ncbi:uncharacterized protein LOC112993034 [Dromaius novaehollandiae]|uniref:uncharacterized protein LOC112993034 n=1 Tax=Dromaius novaehollandiae TaxID=8790 RepID=UPI000E1E6C46|nr:uncharacterized protein LOC112993034 [Dromaius novaehollandiae]
MGEEVSLHTKLKLSLAQSVTEISLAIQAVAAGSRFELCSKRELLQTLLEVIQEEPRESLVCPPPWALVAMQQLSKLQPRLSREENCSLLAQCCQGIMCLRHLEQMEEEGEMVAAAPRCACAIPASAGPAHSSSSPDRVGPCLLRGHGAARLCLKAVQVSGEWKDAHGEMVPPDTPRQPRPSQPCCLHSPGLSQVPQPQGTFRASDKRCAGWILPEGSDLPGQPAPNRSSNRDYRSGN